MFDATNRQNAYSDFELFMAYLFPMTFRMVPFFSKNEISILPQHVSRHEAEEVFLRHHQHHRPIRSELAKVYEGLNTFPVRPDRWQQVKANRRLMTKGETNNALASSLSRPLRPRHTRVSQP